jgi:hypothetical protein
LDQDLEISLKRMNGSCEYRRVRRPAGLKNFKKKDYDSVESCSDDDEISSHGPTKKYVKRSRFLSK